MATYGVDLYAKSHYGIDIPVRFSVQPFSAHQYEHGELAITWSTPSLVSTAQGGKSWSALRLIRNLYGFPVSATDGEVLLQVPSTAPVESFNDMTAPVGRYAYYSIFVLTTHDAWSATQNYNIGDQITYASQNWIAIAPSINQAPGSGSAWSTSSSATEWVYAGSTVGLVVADWQYSEFMYDHTPRAYKVNVVETTGSNLDANNDLWRFLRIFGFGFDIMKTENNSLLKINNIELTRDRYILSIAEQLGIGTELPDEPSLRRLRVLNAASIARQRGSVPGLTSLVQDTTGWGANITGGYNLLLDIDQASWAHPITPAWDPAVRYHAGQEFVRWQGTIWQCLTANMGVVPSTVGTPPSNSTPDYWKPIPTLPLPWTWRGWWTSTANYSANDVVVLAGDNTHFYVASTASGPNNGGAQTPGVSGWTSQTSLPNYPSVTYAGVFNASTTYAVNLLVMTAASPNGTAWISVAPVPTTNPYWLGLTAFSDVSGPGSTPITYNWAINGVSTWTAFAQGANTPAPVGVVVDGIPATGGNPPRNVMQVSNSDTSAHTIVTRTVSPTYYRAWTTTLAAHVGMVATYQGRNYVCTEGITSGTVTPDLDTAHWSLYGPVPGELLAIREGVPIPRIRAWDHNYAYQTGDKVAVNGNVYQATFPTVGVSPSGYEFDSRGWRWIGQEQPVYTASVYYERQAPTASTQISAYINWFGPQNNFLMSSGIYQYPQLFDHFNVDGPIGGTAGTSPGSYPLQPAYANPFPISWIDCGGPWNVDNNVLHTVYPPTQVSHQILAMSENTYGTSAGTDLLGVFVTFVSAPQDPNREQGIIFNLDHGQRTYWMASRTRLTKNTYDASFTTTAITQVGAAWTYIPDGHRIRITKSGQNFAGYTANGLGTETALFSITDAFSPAGGLHGVGERPMS